MRICAPLKIFYAGTTTKTLSQHSKQCKENLVFYDNNAIDMLKLGCTLPHLANVCLHKSSIAKFYPFTETDKDLLQKIREDMVGGPSIVFARKTVVDETFIRNSRNICKSIVGIDASQLYPYSMCQPMPTGLCTPWDYDTESNTFKPQQNKSRKFESMVMSYFQRQRHDCKIESFYTTGTQKKQIDCFKIDSFCAHCKTVFEAMGCFYLYCSCQEARPSLTEEDIERGHRKKELDQIRKQYIKKKDIILLKCGNVRGGICIRRQRVLKNICENLFLTNVH